MEASTRHRRTGWGTPGRRGSCSWEYESKRNLCLEERARHPCDRWRKKGLLQNRDGPHRTGALSGQGQGAQGSRQKRGRSPHECPSPGHREKGHAGEQWSRRPGPAQGSQADRPHSRRARRDAALAPRLLGARSRLCRLSVKTARRRRQDRSETRPPSPQRCRPALSPEVPAPLAGLPTRLFTHLGSLEEALGELQAPGGAFLPVPAPAGTTQPTASQRAWLTWQLAHAGAALHWAMAALDSMLAAQPWPAAPQPWPAAPQPCTPWAPLR